VTIEKITLIYITNNDVKEQAARAVLSVRYGILEEAYYEEGKSAAG
jgi:hypothetical protein